MRYTFILTLAALAGCGGTTMFHSANSTRVVICNGAGLWMIPGTTASSQYHNCRENYLKAGYVEGPPSVRPSPMETPPPQGLPLEERE
jgi:hypothetical protein